MFTEPKLKRIGTPGGKPWIAYRYGQFTIYESCGRYFPVTWTVGVSAYGKDAPWEGRKEFNSLEEAKDFAHEQWLLSLSAETRLQP